MTTRIDDEGDPKETPITQQDRDLVEKCKDAINKKGEKNYSSFTIVKAATQVTSYTNKFYHLNADSGKYDITVSIYCPKNEAPMVMEFSEGHKALKVGH